MNVDAIEFMLYLTDWETDDECVTDFSDDMIASLFKKWQSSQETSRNAEHFGDCTQQPWTCIRCEHDARKAIAERIALATGSQEMLGLTTPRPEPGLSASLA